MIITSPLYITLPRKKSAGKRVSLNLNYFRNAKHFELNALKIAYTETMREQIQSIIKVKWPIKLRCRYYLQRKSDIGNWHSIVEKFFCDALVQFGRIPDDNVQYIIGGNYHFAGYDPKNPRCEIELMENCQ